MDTLDDIVGERCIEPQLAMSILSHFGRRHYGGAAGECEGEDDVQGIVETNAGGEVSGQGGARVGNIEILRELPLLRRGLDFPD